MESSNLNFKELYPDFGLNELGLTGMTANSKPVQQGSTHSSSIFSSPLHSFDVVHFEKYATIQVSPTARRICNFNNGSWRDYEWAIRSTSGEWSIVKDSITKRDLERSLWTNKNYDIDVIIGDKISQYDTITITSDPFQHEEFLRVNKNLTIELDTANKKIKELENSLNKAYTDLNLTNGAIRQLTQENRKLEADIADAQKIKSKKSFISKIFNL